MGTTREDIHADDGDMVNGGTGEAGHESRANVKAMKQTRTKSNARTNAEPMTEASQVQARMKVGKLRQGCCNEGLGEHDHPY